MDFWAKESFNMILIRENDYGDGLVLEGWSLIFMPSPLSKFLQCFPDLVPISLPQMFLTPPVSDSSFSSPKDSVITNVSVLWFSDLEENRG